MSKNCDGPEGPERVNHPPHYGGEEDPYEVIKVILAWELDFLLGNVVKYVARAGKKGINTEIEDLEKARWYLSTKIFELEKRRADELY